MVNNKRCPWVHAIPEEVQVCCRSFVVMFENCEIWGNRHWRRLADLSRFESPVKIRFLRFSIIPDLVLSLKGCPLLNQR